MSGLSQDGHCSCVFSGLRFLRMVTGRGHSLLGPLPSLLSGGLWPMMLVLFVVDVTAVCPYCFGNVGSCEFDAKGLCPAKDVPARNAGVVAGTAALVAAGTALSLTDVVRPRFLRMFSKAHLSALLQLIKRPAAGTIFEIKVDSKLSDVLQAISVGQLTLEHAMVCYAAFIDDESDKDKRSALHETYKLLSSTKEMKGFSTSASASADVGVWTWLYGKVSTFVAEKGMQTSVSLDMGSSSESQRSSVMTSTIKRFKQPWDFMEALNLFMLFAVALGMCTCTVMAEFYEFVVFDTIRMRGQPWQLAAEVLVVMLRRIEDSAGRLTLVSATDEVHLNSVLDEARSNAVHFHGEAAFFRSRAGMARREGADGTYSTEVSKWNKKFSSSSGTACVYFNSGRDHPASALHPDGTCRFNHVCDHWVSDKGKGGRCMGTAGTPGHARDACDNPKRCESKQQ